MKGRLRFILSLYLLTVSVNEIYAQVPAFWGMTKEGGTDNLGVIFKMQPDGSGYSVQRNFTFSTPGEAGDEVAIQLWQAPTGKLYGITGRGGVNNRGVLFEYDIATGTYTKKFDFVQTTGAHPTSSLVAGANGKLYGLTNAGGASGKGALFEYDYTSNTYTKKIDFNTTNGANPTGGSLYLHSNNKFYGVTTFGGANNLGTLFEYDPANNTLTRKIDFNSTNGKYPFGTLILAANGLLYGTTLNGGTNDTGTLFQYDLSTNVLTKRVDFANASGSNPANALVQADNGKLYGTTSAGGTTGMGVLFEFNTTTNTYTKKIDFNSGGISGAVPMGGMFKAANGKLYGVTVEGGNSDAGVLYEYDVTTNTYTKKIELLIDPVTEFSSTGSSTRANLMQASNGLLYGITGRGGSGNKGVLFEYSISNNTYTSKVGFNAALSGKYPYNRLTQASNGKLYGFTFEGGTSNAGVLFELNPTGNVFVKKHDFERTTGIFPSGALTLASNGKLYGLTQLGGTANNDGVLFEYDPVTGVYTKKYEFNSTNGREPRGTLIATSNNKLYGMTSYGGPSDDGVIFEYDLSTNVYTKKKDLGFTTGSNPLGDLIQTPNGKLYGLTMNGGFGGDGVLFEYDPATNSYINKFDFDDFQNQKGSEPRGSLQLAQNGKLYGMTRQGGANSVGVLFEYDMATSTLTKKIDFDGTARGANPSGSMTLSSNGKLYGGTSYGGTGNTGVIFEYDPATNTYTKKQDLTVANGSDRFYGGLLLMSCTTLSKPTISVANTTSGSVMLTSSASSGNQWFLNGTAIASATNATYTATVAGIYKVRVSESVCVSDFSDEVPLIVTGDIDSADSGITIYPNPATDWITISMGALPGKKEVTILDLSGMKLQYEDVYDTEVKIHVASYRAGIYLLRVKSLDATKTIRFIKK